MKNNGCLGTASVPAFIALWRSSEASGMKNVTGRAAWIGVLISVQAHPFGACAAFVARSCERSWGYGIVMVVFWYKHRGV